MPFIGDSQATRELRAVVARHTRRRLARIAASVSAHGDQALADMIRSALGRLARGGAGGEAVLFGAAARAAASNYEISTRLAALAQAALALPRGERRATIEARLFAAVAETPMLLSVAPRQVADAGFARRCLSAATRLRRTTLADLALLLAPHARGLRAPVTVDLVPREDAEEALTGDEVRLGGGPYIARLGRGTGLRLAHTGDHLVFTRGRAELLRIDPTLLAEGAPACDRIAERPLLAGSPSLRLGRRLVSRPASLTVGDALPGLERKLGRALTLIRRAWPEAWEEIHLVTELVIPLDEPGVVSYSLPARPGVSYINVWKKPFLQLVDDLLHEAAHHKLHAIEELEALVRDAGEPLWWSPWRRAWRPLRGLVHAAYTFTYGALLFARLLALPASDLDQRGRLTSARRLLEEDTMLRFAARDLARARRRGLLGPAGCGVERDLGRCLAGPLALASRRARRVLAGEGARGLRVLAGLARLSHELAAMRRSEPGVLVLK